MAVLDKNGTEYLWNKAKEKFAAKDDVPEIPEGVVLYTEQSLTDDQKTQARGNIGAVNSWEELEDKPFGDALIVVFEGDNLTPENADGGYMLTATVDDELTVGQQYIVVIDGVEYTSTAQSLFTYVIIGNPVFFTGENDNGLPFMAFVDMGTITFLSTNAFSSISISYNSAKKIPAKYIPDMTTVFGAWDGLSGTWLYPKDTNGRKITLSELRTAVNSGRVLIEYPFQGYLFTPLEIYLGETYGSVTFVSCTYPGYESTYVTLYTEEYVKS